MWSKKETSTRGNKKKIVPGEPSSLVSSKTIPLIASNMMKIHHLMISNPGRCMAGKFQ